MRAADEWVHRETECSSDSQTKLVCGARRAVALYDGWVYRATTRRWAKVTCPTCLAARPAIGVAAGPRRTHYQYASTVAGETYMLSPCTVSREKANGRDSFSTDPSDVTCGRCHKSRAMRPIVEAAAGIMAGGVA